MTPSFVRFFSIALTLAATPILDAVLSVVEVDGIVANRVDGVTWSQGDAVHARFEYEPRPAPDLDPSTNVARYESIVRNVEITFQTAKGDVPFFFSGVDVELRNDLGTADRIRVQGDFPPLGDFAGLFPIDEVNLGAFPTSERGFGFLSFQFDDTDQSVLASTQLPTLFPDLEAFRGLDGKLAITYFMNTVFLNDAGEVVASENTEIEITGGSVVVIPEQGQLPLLLTGLIFLLLGRRRQ